MSFDINFIFFCSRFTIEMTNLENVLIQMIQWLCIWVKFWNWNRQTHTGNQARQLINWKTIPFIGLVKHQNWKGTNSTMTYRLTELDGNIINKNGINIKNITDGIAIKQVLMPSIILDHNRFIVITNDL